CLFAEGQFAAVSKANAAIAVLLLVTVPLIWWFGLAGLAAGFVASQFVGLGMLARRAGTPRRLSKDWRLLRRLVREGLPFLGSNIVYTIQSSIDRLVVLSYYGERYLGLYSLALQ